MSSISVYIRMRPLLSHQKQQQSVRRRIHFDEEKNEIGVELTEKKEKVFRFDRILDNQCTQEHLYTAIDMQALINRVVDGYHSTIFAYGQTGSGKTFTIEGQSGTTQGLIPRSIVNLFQSIHQKQQSHPGLSFKVNLSFLQIYNQQIYDLIDANKKPLKMRWNKYQQFIVENLFQGQCRDEKEALLWWKKGQKSKIIDSHNMNKESSRSHCILTMKVSCCELEDPSNCVESKLEIVDLAGSERQKVTKATGIVFREGIEINKSLFSLRQVIAALYESNTGTSKSSNIPPYRDSKLTSLLKQSIGGNAYCAMIACINPTLTHFQQSLQTLTYASMATYINNSPARNIDPKIKENQILKQHNYNLKEEITKLSSHIEYLTALLQKNVCDKCGNFNTIKIDTNDQRLPHPRFHKLITQPDAIQGMKLPKFSTLPEPKLSSKQTLNQPSPLTQTQTKYFKKRTQPQQKSFTQQQTPKLPVYQLKNPKQILQSITMIRDLINTNTKLRDKIEMMREQHEKMEKETFQIIQENQLLRERWEMVGTSLKMETEVQTENEAPISLYERLLKQQKGQPLVYMPKSAQWSQTSTMNYKNSQKLVSLRSMQKQTEPVSGSQNLRAYRPYHQIFKSASSKKKENIMGRKKNLSNASRKEKFDSFLY